MNMVLLSKVTSYAGSDGELLPGGDWGMGTFFNEFFLQWGFLGAILVANVAQLASQVTASIFPIAVINNHFMYWLLVLMLFIETAGFQRLLAAGVLHRENLQHGRRSTTGFTIG